MGLVYIYSNVSDDKIGIVVNIDEKYNCSTVNSSYDCDFNGKGRPGTFLVYFVFIYKKTNRNRNVSTFSNFNFILLHINNFIKDNSTLVNII